MKDESMKLIRERIEYLRHHTDFVSTLFENLVGYAIIAADFDGNIIAYNEGARLIYGYAPEEIIGIRHIDIFFLRKFIETGKLQQVVDELIGKGRISFEEENTRKNAEIFPAQILLTLTKNEYDNIVGFIVIVEDLSERKRSEEVLTAKKYTESIIERFLDTLIVVNTEAKIKTINPETCNLLGYSKDELVGQPVEMVFEESEKARDVFQFFKYTDKFNIGNHMQIRNVELTFKAKGGRRIPMSFNASVLTDSHGIIAGIVAGAKDISDIKRVDAARIEQLERERAEVIRSYQHLKDISQRRTIDTEILQHPSEDTLYGLAPDYKLIVQRYIRAVRTGDGRPKEQVRAFAHRLAAINASARDVIRLHLRILNEFSERAMSDEERAFSNDARLVLVELLGNIMDIYLNASVDSLINERKRT